MRQPPAERIYTHTHSSACHAWRRGKKPFCFCPLPSRQTNRSVCATFAVMRRPFFPLSPCPVCAYFPEDYSLYTCIIGARICVAWNPVAPALGAGAGAWAVGGSETTTATTRRTTTPTTTTTTMGHRRNVEGVVNSHRNICVLYGAVDVFCDRCGTMPYGHTVCVCVCFCVLAVYKRAHELRRPMRRVHKCLSIWNSPLECYVHFRMHTHTHTHSRVSREKIQMIISVKASECAHVLLCIHEYCAVAAVLCANESARERGGWERHNGERGLTFHHRMSACAH